MTLLTMLSVILLAMLMILISNLSVIRHLNCGNKELDSELESDLQDTVDWSRKWLVNLNAGKTQLVLFHQPNNKGAIDVKTDGSVLEEKSSLKMLGLNCHVRAGAASCYLELLDNLQR